MAGEAEVYHRTVSHPRPRYLNVIREIIPFPELDRLCRKRSERPGENRPVHLFDTYPVGRTQDSLRRAVKRK